MNCQNLRGAVCHRYRQGRFLLFPKLDRLFDSPRGAQPGYFREDLLPLRQIGIHVVGAFFRAFGAEQRMKFLEGLFHLPGDLDEVAAGLLLIRRVLEHRTQDHGPHFRPHLGNVPANRAG